MRQHLAKTKDHPKALFINLIKLRLVIEIPCTFNMTTLCRSQRLCEALQIALYSELHQASRNISRQDGTKGIDKFIEKEE